MMKRKMLLAAALLFLLSSACGAGKDTGNTGVGTSTESAKESAESVAMTDQEIVLLSKIYPMEERIREGRLYDYQKDTLETYRAGMEYLSGKYPGYDFKALSITPATKPDPWMVIRIQSGDSGIWEVKVTPEDGGLSFADTFYNDILREAYDGKAEELLKEAGLDARVFTEFTAFRENIGPQTTAEELMGMNARELPRMTHIFLAAAGDTTLQDEDLGKAEDTLRACGISGSYILYFVPSGFSGDIRELEAERLKMESAVFNIS